MPQRRSLAILSAFCKALLIWILLYILLLHCFIAWKWQTPVDNTAAQAQALKLKQQATQRHKTQLNQLQSKHQRELQQIQNYMNQLQQQNPITEIKKSLQQTKLQAPTNIRVPQFKPKTKQNATLENFQQLLLQTPSLSFVENLELTFQTVLEELQTCRDASLLDWAQVTQLLRSIKQPPKTTSSCPTTTTLATYRQANELLRQLKLLREHRSWQSLWLALNTTQERIQTKLQLALDEQAKRNNNTITTVSSEQKTVVVSNDDCLYTTNVLAWVQAGLDAQYRHLDLRQALLDAMENDGIDTLQIILDADLQDHDKKEHSVTPSLTLRQVLDRPMTQQISKWMDQWVDVASGHSDTLDQWLDDTLVSDFGSLVVSQLLQAAGHVQLSSRQE